MPQRLFALDHNFPEPIVDLMTNFIVAARLVPVRRIDSGFPLLDDWELLRDLHRHREPWDGLITTDSNILRLPKELVVLQQTRLTLVVAKGQGHNPLRATGVLFAHLEHVCNQTTLARGQIWQLQVNRSGFAGDLLG